MVDKTIVEDYTEGNTLRGRPDLEYMMQVQEMQIEGAHT